MSEVNDIWKHNAGGLPEDKLMAYLEGRLSAAEQHEVEQWLAEEGLESDAIEGLHELDTHEAQSAVRHLNHQLQSKLGKKHNRRHIADNRWVWLAVVIILLLAVLSYYVIRLSLHKQ